MFGRKKQPDDRSIKLLISLAAQTHFSRVQFFQNELNDPDRPPFKKGVMMQHENTQNFVLVSLLKAIDVLKEGGTEEQAKQAFIQAMNYHLSRQWEGFKDSP